MASGDNRRVRSPASVGLSGLDGGFVRVALTVCGRSDSTRLWHFLEGGGDSVEDPVPQAAADGERSDGPRSPYPCCFFFPGAPDPTPPRPATPCHEPRAAVEAAAAPATPDVSPGIGGGPFTGDDAVLLSVISSVMTDGCHARKKAEPPSLALSGVVRLFHYEGGGPDPETVGGLVCLYAVSDSVISPDSALPSMLEPFTATMVRGIVCAEPRHARALVLLWFVSPSAGREFVAAMNGQPFDRDRGSERCHAMVLTELAFGAGAAAVSVGLGSCFEIPRCPVCLEMLDHTLEPTLLHPITRGALAPCWQRMWERCGTCALLRSSHPVTRHNCHACAERNRLWGCMVCAFVGCSRPQYVEEGAAADPTARSRKGHMLEHWIETGHRHKLAVDLSSQWVWDYQRDGFVHHSQQSDDSPSKSVRSGPRVVDGDVTSRDGLDAAIDSPAAADGAVGDDGKPLAWTARLGNGDPAIAHAATYFPDESKAEQITTEYVGLLSSQLESQRQYFAETAARTKARTRDKLASLQTELAAAVAESAALETKVRGASNDLHSAVTAQRESTTRLSVAFAQLRSERSRCQKLMADQAEWQARVAKARSGIEAELAVHRNRAARLREENADLSAALAMKRHISTAPPEVQAELKEGTMVAGEPAPAADQPRKGKRRSKGGRR
mmetsp:Transcript_4482/g.11433  ORF Transcript_4482/g.11433 Transcript_4482/m.11433 type:complete len:669 (+) Transcript_4482:125-2131(+)